MAKGNRVGIKGRNGRNMRQRDEDSEESDEEYKVTEDEEYDESDECYSFDGDESEDILADFQPSKRVARSRNTRRTSSGRKEKEMINARKRRRVLYTEDDDDDEEKVAIDDDDAEFMSLDRKTKQIKKPTRKKMVSDSDVDDYDVEDDAECTSLGRKTNQITKPAERKRFSDTEVDDNDDDDVDDDYNEEEEEEEDCSTFVSSRRKRNHRKKPREKKRDLYTEENENEYEDEDDDEDYDHDDEGDEYDDEFRYSGRKGNQKKKLREKKKILYTEDEEDDYAFMSTSRKRNQVIEPREKSIVSYKEDNEEEDDEKDAEFKLSESDFVDDEDEESPKMKNNDKVTKSRPHKKTVQGGWITVKKSNTKKPSRAKQRNNRTGRKLGPVRNKNQVEKRSKKISKRRNHSSVPESDSESVTASSDHEYTISEDEREQMREASVYCANVRAKPRSSSCGNQQEPPSKERKYSLRKGKEKIEEIKDEAGKQVCGICLSEEGKRTVQGVLNCCRHYFCFTCIMEWSKVESRCPLCKQRFATITKAAKSDATFDLRTVVIPVPECDQVYQPSEEEVRGYLDPYESVICSECHNGGDDALMLLCDVCDSSAHTFCVGLGQEVPEGNWYCEGCRPTVLFGSLNSQQPTPPTTSDRRLSSNASELSSPVAGGFDLNELYVPETPLTQQTREPRHTVGEFNPAPNGTGATTLRDRRRIHRQIHHHRLINNNNNRTLASSSSGIRLFGSQLDQTITSSQRAADPRASFIGREDHIIRPARADQFGVQVQNSNFPFVDESLQDEHSGSGIGFDSRFGYAQLRPCNNRSSIGTDACREVIGPSRTSQGGLHAP